MVIGETMKKALCDTNTSVKYISSWEHENPVYSIYENSARICEVTSNQFEVHTNLIWVDCEDNIVPDQFWYDKMTGIISPIQNAEKPLLDADSIVYQTS